MASEGKRADIRQLTLIGLRSVTFWDGTKFWLCVRILMERGIKKGEGPVSHIAVHT